MATLFILNLYTSFYTVFFTVSRVTALFSFVLAQYQKIVHLKFCLHQFDALLLFGLEVLPITNTQPKILSKFHID